MKQRYLATGITAAGIALLGAPAAHAQPGPLETFVVKVVCQRAGEGWTLDRMASQLVADRMVYTEADGELLVRRAVASGCPDLSESL